MNKFMNNVNETRKNIEIVEAEKAAKDIKQYGGLDVYNLMKEGKMYAIVVDGIVIGGATSKEDAEAAVEFLTHFTGGMPLNKNSIMSAMRNSTFALEKANDLIEAEKEGNITIKKTYNIKGKEYIVDETKELYTIDGKHICNVADLLDAKLSPEIMEEILVSRIEKAEEESYEDEEDEDWDDDYDDYDDCDEYDDDEDYCW